MGYVYNIYLEIVGNLAYSFKKYLEGRVHFRGEMSVVERVNYVISADYLAASILNMWGGYIFSFDERGAVCAWRGLSVGLRCTALFSAYVTALLVRYKSACSSAG